MEIYKPAKEKLLRLTEIGLLGIALSACNGAVAIDRNTVFWGDEELKTEKNIAHEACHQEDMIALSESVFWQNYIADEEFRCAAEIKCDAVAENHFACYGEELDEYTPERIEEIFDQARDFKPWSEVMIGGGE